MRDVEKMHSHVIKLGFDQNIYVIGKIVAFCAVNECGLMDYAVSGFRKDGKPGWVSLEYYDKGVWEDWSSRKCF